MSDLRSLPSLSYIKPIPTLQLLCLQTSYRVQFDHRHSVFILNAGFNIFMYFLSAFIMTLLLLSYLCSTCLYILCWWSNLLWVWEKGFTLYVHCLSSRVNIGDTSEVERP